MFGNNPIKLKDFKKVNTIKERLTIIQLEIIK